MCEREKEGEGEGEKNDDSSRFKVYPRRRQKYARDDAQAPPISNFFVANIPDGCRPWDLADVMKAFGSISRVFIAQKRNKDGVRFGFVSFVGVKDTSELEKSMQNVKIGKWKLKINVAWHAKENGVQPKERKSVRHTLKPILKPATDRVFEKSATNRPSFRDVVSGESGRSNSEVVVPIADEYVGMSSAFKRSLIAKCVSFDILNSLFSRLCESGCLVDSIQYVGGLSVLLVCKDEKGASDFQLNKELWRDWFSRLEIWNGQITPFERIAWVWIYGIPLHLSSAEVVNKIGNMVGKVVIPSIATECVMNKSVERLGLLVGDGSEVKKVVSLKWRDKVLRVWVEEKSIDWCPPCGSLKSNPPPTVEREEGEIFETAVEHDEQNGGANIGQLKQSFVFSSPTGGGREKGDKIFDKVEWDFIQSDSGRPKKRRREVEVVFLSPGKFPANMDIEVEKVDLNKDTPINANLESEKDSQQRWTQQTQELNPIIQMQEIASPLKDSCGEHEGEGSVAFEHYRDELVQENFTHLDEQVNTIYNEVTNSEFDQADMNQDPELLSEVWDTKEIGNLLQMNMEGFEALIEQAIIEERRSSCPPQHPTGY